MTAGRVLGVFAHPDDESLLAGGTLAACAAAGLDVAVLCLTHGEQGPIASPDLATRETLAAVREGELRAAARRLGVAVVDCLDYPDGALDWVDKGMIEADLARRVGRWRPEAVITFGPEGLYWHPDHVAVCRFMTAVLDTLAGEAPPGGRPWDPWVYHATWPKGYASGLVSAAGARGLPTDLWGLRPEAFGVRASAITTALDVRPFLAPKLRALRSHRSQLAADHLFCALPDDLAEEFLGREYFARTRPAGAAGDWLADVVGAAAAGLAAAARGGR